MQPKPIPTAWVHPQTFHMLSAFGLIKNDQPAPFLSDGRYVAVSGMMPSRGIYDEPTRELAEALVAAQVKADEGRAV